MVCGTLQIFFRNRTFLFVKIDSWNFQYLFDSLFLETSQNFRSFGQLFSTHTKMSSKCLSEWAYNLQGFMKLYIKQLLKISAFYLDKQKSFIPKKIWSVQCTMDNYFFQPPDAVIYLNSPSINGSGKDQKVVWFFLSDLSKQTNTMLFVFPAGHLCSVSFCTIY